MTWTILFLVEIENCFLSRNPDGWLDNFSQRIDDRTHMSGAGLEFTDFFLRQLGRQHTLNTAAAYDHRNAQANVADTVEIVNNDRYGKRAVGVSQDAFGNRHCCSGDPEGRAPLTVVDFKCRHAGFLE